MIPNPLCVLSDIHANATAYYAVLEDIQNKFGNNFDIAILGDIVDYGPDLEDCVNLTLEIWCNQVENGNKFWCVAGNHEHLLTGICHPSQLKSDRGRKSLELTKKAFENLDEDLQTFIRNLPLTIIDRWNGHSIIIKHWDLFDSWHGDPMTPIKNENTIVLFGHNHKPFIETDDNETYHIINPGSVGQPRNGDPKAQYAIIHPSMDVEFRLVPYDIESVISRMDPEQDSYYSERLRHGK